MIVKAVNYYFGNGFFVNYAKTSITMQNTSIAIFLDAVPPIKNELNEKLQQRILIIQFSATF